MDHQTNALRYAGEGQPRGSWTSWRTSSQRSDWHSMTTLEQHAYVALRDAGYKHNDACRKVSDMSTEHNDEYGN